MMQGANGYRALKRRCLNSTFPVTENHDSSFPPTLTWLTPTTTDVASHIEWNRTTMDFDSYQSMIPYLIIRLKLIFVDEHLHLFISKTLLLHYPSTIL
jgi:hypothetical protein